MSGVFNGIGNVDCVLLDAVRRLVDVFSVLDVDGVEYWCLFLFSDIQAGKETLISFSFLGGASMKAAAATDDDSFLLVAILFLYVDSEENYYYYYIFTLLLLFIYFLVSPSFSSCYSTKL